MVVKNIKELKKTFPSPEYEITTSIQEYPDRTYRYYTITSNNYTVDENYVKEYFSRDFIRTVPDIVRDKNRNIVYNNIGNFDVFTLLKYKAEEKKKAEKSFFIFEPMNTALSYGKFLKTGEFSLPALKSIKTFSFTR